MEILVRGEIRKLKHFLVDKLGLFGIVRFKSSNHPNDICLQTERKKTLVYSNAIPPTWELCLPDLKVSGIKGGVLRIAWNDGVLIAIVVWGVASEPPLSSDPANGPFTVHVSLGTICTPSERISCFGEIFHPTRITDDLISDSHKFSYKLTNSHLRMEGTAWKINFPIVSMTVCVFDTYMKLLLSKREWVHIVPDVCSLNISEGNQIANGPAATVRFASHDEQIYVYSITIHMGLPNDC